MTQKFFKGEEMKIKTVSVGFKRCEEAEQFRQTLLHADQYVILEIRENLLGGEVIGYMVITKSVDDAIMNGL